MTEKPSDLLLVEKYYENSYIRNISVSPNQVYEAWCLFKSGELIEHIQDKLNISTSIEYHFKNIFGKEIVLTINNDDKHKEKRKIINLNRLKSLQGNQKVIKKAWETRRRLNKTVSRSGPWSNEVKEKIRQGALRFIKEKDIKDPEWRKKYGEKMRKWLQTEKGKEHSRKCGFLTQSILKNRKYMTSIEVKMKGILLNNFKFFEEKDFNVKPCVGGRFPDFRLNTDMLLIECDGDHWHNTEKQRKIDHIKDEIFINSGYRVLHISGSFIEKTNNVDIMNYLLEMISKDFDVEYKN